MTSRLSRLGGWLDLKTGSSGFFRVERLGERWWLVDPDGHAFLSIGHNHLSSFALWAPERIDEFLAKYRDEERPDQGLRGNPSVRLRDRYEKKRDGSSA